MLLRPWNLKGLCSIVCFGRLKGVCLFLIFSFGKQGKSWPGLAVLPCVCAQPVPVRKICCCLGRGQRFCLGSSTPAPQLLFWCVSRKLLWGFFCILGAITQIFILLLNQTESKFLMVWGWDCLFWCFWGCWVCPSGDRSTQHFDSRVMCVAGEALVLVLSFQAVVVALCRLFPLSEDGRRLSPSASLHWGLWVIKNIHFAAFGYSYFSTALLCRSQTLKTLAGYSDHPFFHHIKHFLCVWLWKNGK